MSPAPSPALPPPPAPRRRLAALWNTRFLGVVFIVSLLALWEIAAAKAFFPPMSFPRISAILSTWWQLLLSGELVGELLPSLWRMFAGYFIGVALGVGFGLMMGYFRFFYNLLEPITEVLRPIPSPAYLPIMILFLGIDDEMKIFMIAFATVFPVLLNTYSGVRSVDPIQLQTARTFGVSGRKLLTQIVLPASSPYIFTGMRVSLAVALIVMVISEMVAASNGIGYFILSAQRGFKIRDMFAGVLTLAMLGYVLNRLFLLIENRVLAWHYGYTQQRKLSWPHVPYRRSDASRHLRHGRHSEDRVLRAISDEGSGRHRRQRGAARTTHAGGRRCHRGCARRRSA